MGDGERRKAQGVGRKGFRSQKPAVRVWSKVTRDESDKGRD